MSWGLLGHSHILFYRLVGIHGLAVVNTVRNLRLSSQRLRSGSRLFPRFSAVSATTQIANAKLMYVQLTRNPVIDMRRLETDKQHKKDIS